MASARYLLLLPALALGLSPYVNWTGLVPALLLVWMLSLHRAGRARWDPLDARDLLALAWLAWLPMTLLWSRAPMVSEELLYALLPLPLAFLAWRHWRDSAAAWDWVRLFLACCAALLALWGILEPPQQTVAARPDGPFTDPNVYAAALNLFLLPLLASYLHPPEARQRLVDGGLLLLAGVILLAYFMVASRGAGLAALLVAPLILWKARGQPGLRERLTKLAVVAALAYGAADQVMHTDLGGRLAETVSSGDTPRVLLWQSTWAMIQEHPWLGTGLGSFRYYYPLYRSPGEQGSGGFWAHNDYLQLWQEGGIITLALLLAIGVALVREAWGGLRQGGPRSAERLGLAAACLAMFIHAGVNFLLYVPFASLLIGLYWARAAQLAEQPVNTWRLRLQVSPALRRGALAVLLVVSLYFMISQPLLLLFNAGTQPAMRLARSWGWSEREITLAQLRLRPEHPLPALHMAQMIKYSLAAGGSGEPAQDARLYTAAEGFYDISRRSLYCNFTDAVAQADFQLRFRRHDASAAAARRALAILRENLACAPKHGLSHYYLAQALRLAGDDDGARQALKEAYRAVLYRAEKFLIQATWVEVYRDIPPFSPESLADQVASHLYYLERFPMSKPDEAFWHRAKDDMRRLFRGQASSAAKQGAMPVHRSEDRSQ